MRMKCFAKIFRFMPVLVATCLLPGTLSAAELSQGEQDTIFIGELKVQPAVLDSASTKGRGNELEKTVQSLDTQFISALNGTRVFQLVERKRKGDIEREQSLAAVVADPEDKNLARAGKMAGARFAFLPQIDGFEDRSETVRYQAIGRAALNRKIFLSAVVQVVDTTTGKLLPDSPSIQLTKTETVENARPGQATGSDRVLVELAREMAGKLSRELVALLRPAKVLAVTGKQLMINRGSEAGFKKSDVIEIYATQDVKDDDTGETFRNEIPVGQASIVRLDTKQSFATIVGEDVGIARGCIARIVKAAYKGGPEGKAAIPDGNGDKQTPGSSDKPLKW
jgi:curli biogenesis system outer membrane secretion channel CsgG